LAEEVGIAPQKAGEVPHIFGVGHEQGVELLLSERAGEAGLTPWVGRDIGGALAGSG
jgi:hypothetical protein